LALDLPAGYATSIAPKNGRVRAALRKTLFGFISPYERSGIFGYLVFRNPGRCSAKTLPTGAAGIAGNLLKRRKQKECRIWAFVRRRQGFDEIVLEVLAYLLKRLCARLARARL
jgi:hypothetical protein